MTMEKAIIVSDQCPSCKVLLDSLRQKGALEKYRVLDVNTPEGIDVAKKLGLNAVPECIVIVKTQEGEMARRCSEEEIKSILKEARGE